MTKRKYTQRKRAQQADLTRHRIVEATMDLHEKVGAARTTVSAVAKKAGVQRLTVYRHFPDEERLLEACTTRWLELNPLPEAGAWDDRDDPTERLRAALTAFYAYYRRTAEMWDSSYRDRDLVPALAERMDLVEQYLDGVVDGLMAPFALSEGNRRRFFLVLRHGLRFATWRSFDAAMATDDEATALVMLWCEAVRRSGRIDVAPGNGSN